VDCYRGKSDYLAVFDREEMVRSLAPDFGLLAKVPARGVIVTSPGYNHDFVSRFFGPQSGVDEDPVTGSAHTTLAVYWAARLGKNEFTAAQISARGGLLKVRLEGERTLISGRAVTYLQGEISF
jgi:predicted PhzF superfamily epimerase YddE/YHI9